MKKTCLLNKSFICLHFVEYMVKLYIFYCNTYITWRFYNIVFIKLHIDIIYVENLV